MRPRRCQLRSDHSPWPSSAPLYYSIRTRTRRARRGPRLEDRAAKPSFEGRKRLAYLLAELGRAHAAFALMALGSPDERIAIGREVLRGALSGGQIALFDRVRSRCGCALDVTRLTAGLGAAPAWLSEDDQGRRLERLFSALEPVAADKRAEALQLSISGLTTPAEWRTARSFIDAQSDMVTRARLLVALGHALINAKRRPEAIAVAETARSLASPGSQTASDTAWLLFRVGRMAEAAALARSLPPDSRAALLTQMAEAADGD